MLIIPAALAVGALALIRKLSGGKSVESTSTTTAAPMERLLIDTYSGDAAGSRNWLALAADSRFDGGWLKASEGTGYYPSWFVTEWERARQAGVRFLGPYHFLRFEQDGFAQAEAFLAQLAKVGYGSGNDLNPFVDVEYSTINTSSSSRNRIIQVLNDFTDRVRDRTGRTCILYSNTVMNEKGINKSDVHTRGIIMARYTDTFPPTTYTRIGYELKDVVGWQYAGDGHAGSAMRARGYPISPDSFGQCDVTAMFQDPASLCR